MEFFWELNAFYGADQGAVLDTILCRDNLTMGKFMVKFGDVE